MPNVYKIGLDVLSIIHNFFLLFLDSKENPFKTIVILKQLLRHYEFAS